MTKTNKAYKKIWHWYPQDLNHFSSIWWFFLLFPKQEEGYGPKQMMYTLVSRVGDNVLINKVLHSGVGRSRGAETMAEPFPGMALGWIFDGQRMHDNILKQTTTIQVKSGRSIQAWDDNGYGGVIEACDNGRNNGRKEDGKNGRPFSTKALFRGERGQARFEVWGDAVSEMTSPALIDRHTIIGGANVLAWRHLYFEGEFSSPAGTEELTGVGYFQRICLNIAPFPWKWVLARFGDDSFFSCFIPYIGPHLLRRGNWFFPNWLENITVPVQQNAYFCRGKSWQTILFSRVEMKVIVGQHAYPEFLVSTNTENGDFLCFRAVPYTHTQVLLKRLLPGPFSSVYNYNEYPFQITDLTGSIDGKPINSEMLGPGFGNIEYTWGLGL